MNPACLPFEPHNALSIPLERIAQLPRQCLSQCFAHRPSTDSIWSANPVVDGKPNAWVRHSSKVELGQQNSFLQHNQGLHVVCISCRAVFLVVSFDVNRHVTLSTCIDCRVIATLCYYLLTAGLQLIFNFAIRYSQGQFGEYVATAKNVTFDKPSTVSIFDR